MVEHARLECTDAGLCSRQPNSLPACPRLASLVTLEGFLFNQPAGRRVNSLSLPSDNADSDESAASDAFSLLRLCLSADVPSCHSVYLRQDGYLAHANRTEGTDRRLCRLLLGPDRWLNVSICSSCCSFTGCMFDKVVRHFYDDACVVPEKAEGQFSQNSQPAERDQERKKKPACNTCVLQGTSSRSLGCTARARPTSAGARCSSGSSWWRCWTTRPTRTSLRGRAGGWSSSSSSQKR